MATKRSHVFFKNPSGISANFNTSRTVDLEDNDNDKPAEAYLEQKRRFKISKDRFIRNRQERLDNRSLEVPDHIDYIKIDFFIIFKDNNDLKARTIFERKFGLSCISFSNLNQTVLFAITNKTLFDSNFLSLLDAYILSDDQDKPRGKPYAILTLISDFIFLSSSEIFTPIEDVSYDNNIFLFELVNPINLTNKYPTIYHSLMNYIESIKGQDIISYTINEFILELKVSSSRAINSIIDNFDIIQHAQALRQVVAKPGNSTTVNRTWDFEILSDEDVPLVGILDNGIKIIKPLSNIVVDLRLDALDPQNPNSITPSDPHGTAVGCLVALGPEFFDINKKEFKTHAKLVPIRVIEGIEGRRTSLYQVEEAIRKAYQQGVRIFNLSVNSSVKSYNEGISAYAYILDKLTYELDILIVISTGNLDIDDVVAIQDEIVGRGDIVKHLIYPKHFFHPHLGISGAESHNCECSNIMIPSESMNNITVGAIADNLNDDSQSHLTLDKTLPAYYTRKYHINYSSSINGTRFKNAQKNNNIFKPDVVMPGGDMLQTRSGMQILGLGLSANDFYELRAGTSFAAPLVSNIVARIIKLYPTLNMQSVKSLLINSAAYEPKDGFLKDWIDEIKNEVSLTIHNRPFSNLSKAQKSNISNDFKSDRLLKHLVGQGIPSIENCLFSDKKRFTSIIENHIASDSYIAIPIHLPKYLREIPRKKPVIKLIATLCYKFKPIQNDMLNYNPIHISINFLKSVSSNPAVMAEIASNNSHEFYDQFGYLTTEEKTEGRKKELGIKKELQSWSEDFFPSSTKRFSNSQTMELLINPNELEKVNESIYLMVRCTTKKGQSIEPEFQRYLSETEHPFSVALTFIDQSNSDQDLYEEMSAINELEIITEIDIDTDLNADLDI